LQGGAPGPALPGPALIVVPAGLVLQWRRQLREWAPELALSTCIGVREERRQRWRAPAQVYLTGFDSLRGDMALPAPYGPRRRLWQVVVADEAQRIKNAHTAVAAAVKALPRQRAWALTGTPLENHPDDAVSILDFVAPGLYDPAGMVAGLRRALSVVQLRRRRADVLPDLPPKTVFELAPELLPSGIDQQRDAGLDPGAASGNPGNPAQVQLPGLRHPAAGARAGARAGGRPRHPRPDRARAGQPLRRPPAFVSAEPDLRAARARHQPLHLVGLGRRRLITLRDGSLPKLLFQDGSEPGRFSEDRV